MILARRKAPCKAVRKKLVAMTVGSVRHCSMTAVLHNLACNHFGLLLLIGTITFMLGNDCPTVLEEIVQFAQLLHNSYCQLHDRVLHIACISLANTQLCHDLILSLTTFVSCITGSSGQEELNEGPSKCY